MKRWMLCLVCTITLGLGIVGIAGLASAEPASGPPALNPADQQFLASLALPEPTLMAKPAPPSPCGPDFCTSTQQQQCMQHCWDTVWCDGILSCNTTTCTSNCVCGGRCY
jgi:hypothetical protein